MTRILGCLVTVLLGVDPSPRETAAPLPAPAAPATSLAELRPMEVRIRKLFLVRPDLMRYPVPYETLC